MTAGCGKMKAPGDLTRCILMEESVKDPLSGLWKEGAGVEGVGPESTDTLDETCGRENQKRCDKPRRVRGYGGIFKM